MKKALALVPLLLTGSAIKAQTLTIGAEYSSLFNNTGASLVSRLELPIQRKFENDPEFSVGFDYKSGYGNGIQWNAKDTTIFWASSKFGIEGNILYGGYKIPSINLEKSTVTPGLGIIFRGMFLGFPSRFRLDYSHQILNGIDSLGVETSHLQGGIISLESKLGCSSELCFRIEENFEFGHGLNQGNPLCDGTYGNGSQVGFSPCPRSGYWSGGASVAVKVEWPRRKNEDLF